MSVSAVVDNFNPARETRTCSVTGWPALTIVELGFKRQLERLSHRVIEAHTATPHILGNDQVAAHLLQLFAGTLRSVVSVKHQTIRNVTAQRMRHPQRPFDQGSILHAIHSPAQYPAGMAIADCAHLQPALAGAQVGDIRHPHPVKLTSIRHALDQVRKRGLTLSLNCCHRDNGPGSDADGPAHESSFDFSKGKTNAPTADPGEPPF